MPEPRDEEEIEAVDALPVLAEVRPIERQPEPLLPVARTPAAVAAVAATGFVAGAATVAIVRRRSARRAVRRSRRGKGRGRELISVAGTRSFLVDVHLLDR